MSNTNRAIVQEGLVQRAATRKRKMNDAAHEAAERSLRIVINSNTQERRAVTEAAQRQAEAERAEQQRRADSKEAHRAQEVAEISAWNTYMLRVFGSLIVACLVCFCFIQGGMEAWVAIPCIAVAIVYSLGSFVKYILRGRRAIHG